MDVRWRDIIFIKGLDNPPLADGFMGKVKEYVGIEPQIEHINYRRFVDGELDDIFADPSAVRDKTIVFFECLKEESTMLRFLQLCWAAKYQYGARHIIAALSFLHYRRQDRPEKTDEIHRNRWLIEMMRHNGIDHVIVVTPHSRQTEMNCIDVGVGFRAVDPSEAFASVCRPLLPEEDDGEKVLIYSPDEGSISRAIALAKFMDVDIAFNLKHRGFDNETAMIEADEVKIRTVIESYTQVQLQYATPDLIKDATIIMIEDEVDTGGTSNRQAGVLLQYGAKKVLLNVTHAVCSDGWKRKLFAHNPFAKIVMCDTIQRSADKRTGGKVHDVSMAGLIASAVYRVVQKRM